MHSVRLATPADIDEICSFDHLTDAGNGRREFVTRTVADSGCYIAIDEHILGYAVLEYSFYGFGFIPMLYIHPATRTRHWRGAHASP